MTAGCVAAAFHGDTEGLQQAVDAAGGAAGSPEIADVVGLVDALAGKQAAGSYAALVHGHAIADVTGLQGALDVKAPIAGPVFTNIPAAPTANLGTNTTQLATTAFVAAAIANLLSSAPSALDTLNELAAALGNDASFAATMTAALAGKQASDSDLTAIAALTTQTFGRSVLTTADAAALRTLAGLVIGTDVQAAGSYQPLDADLTAIAALTTTAFGRSFLDRADAAAARTLLGLVIGTDVAAIANPVHTGNVFAQQAAPTAKTGSATLTIAELLTGIVTATSATAVALTLPTGTLSDAGILAGALAADRAFEWVVINLGSSSGAVTVGAGTAHTIVGSAIVAIGTSARFRTRKTAANTFVTYRIG